MAHAPSCRGFRMLTFSSPDSTDGSISCSLETDTRKLSLDKPTMGIISTENGDHVTLLSKSSKVAVSVLLSFLFIGTVCCAPPSLDCALSLVVKLYVSPPT